MRRIFTLVLAATTVALSVVACGSDSEPSSSGGAGAPAAGECVGVYADYTTETFVTKHDATKGCSDDDATVNCANDLVTITGTCGKGCLGMGDDAAQAVCVGKCINKKLPSPLSDACTGCYEVDVECARKNCLFDCGLDPTSEKCAVCRAAKGCAKTFYECSGLPAPTGSPDVGAGGSGDSEQPGAGGA